MIRKNSSRERRERSERSDRCGVVVSPQSVDFLFDLNHEMRGLEMDTAHTGHFASAAFPAAVLVQEPVSNGKFHLRTRGHGVSSVMIGGRSSETTAVAARIRFH